MNVLRMKKRRKALYTGPNTASDIGFTQRFDNLLTQDIPVARIKQEREVVVIDKESKLQKVSKSALSRKDSSLGKFNLEYLNLGYYILTPILAGVFLGLVLDKLLATKPVFLLILLLLGTVASFYNLFKLTKNG